MNQPASDSSRRRVGPWFVSTLITQTRSLRLGVAVFLLTSICRGGEIPIADVQRSEPVMFEKDILPLLQRSCLACHSATEKQGDLILESPAAILKGGDSGPAIEAGKGAESLLLKVAAHQQEPVMPPADNDVNAPPLTSEELGLLRLWIDQGAKGTGRVTMLSPGKWQPVTPRFAPTLALSLTRDGQLLAASRGNQLDLYHVPSGQRVTRFSDPALSDAGSTQAPAHRDLIESLSFNTEGDLLASGGFREVKIWRRPRDVQRFQLAVGGPVSAVSTSLDGQWIATASGSQIRLWNAASGQPGPTLSGHTDKVSALRFSKDNTSLLSGSADHSIRRWQLPEGTLVGLIETPLPVLSLEVVDAQDPKTQPHADPLLVVGSTDNLLRTFRWPSAIPQKEDLNVSGDFRIQLSRDRKYAMVAESTGAIRILQADEQSTWKVLSEWKSDRIPVVAVDFVPSANNSEPPFVVVAAGDGSLTITPMAHFAPLRRWRGAPSPFTALTSAPDGRQFASGSESGLITLWRNSESDASKPWADSGGVEVTAVQTHTSRRILALAGLVDGKAVVSIRNLDNGQVTHTVQGHEGPVRSLAFSADGMRLLTGSDDQTVRIWDLSQSVASEIKKFGPLGSPVTALNATTDLARVIAAGADHRVHLWNVADGTLVREFGGHTARVMHVGLLADGQPYSVAADRTTRFWNPADGTQTRAWEMPAVPTAVAVTPDLQRLFAAGDDKGIRSFQLSSGQVLQTFSGHTVGPQALQLSSDLKRMVSLENTGSRTDAFLWDLESARLLEVDEGTAFSSFALVDGPQYRAVVVNATGQVTVRPWYFWKFAEGNQQPITALAFTKNSQQLLSTSRDGSLRGYQVETAQPLFSASHGAPVNGLAIAPNEQWMATAGENGSVRFWQMNGNAFGAQASGNLAPVRSVVVSLNSERVIASTSGDKPTIHMIDPATGFTVERVSVHHQAAQNLFALTEQGDFLSASPDSIQRWRSSAGRQFPGHNGAISSLAAIPQSVMQVVTGCTDSVIRRVNLSNGQVMAQFNHGGPVTGVAVRSDGQRVASVSENHTLKLWNINGQQVAELRGDIRRRTAVTRRTQQQTAANERVTRTRQLVESAEKDVPVKTEAAAKTSAALTAATMDLQQKSAALTTANEQKLAAENASLAASADARKMQMAKLLAETAKKNADAELQVAQQRLTQRQAASANSPNDATLKQAAAEAQQTLNTAQASVQSQQQAVATALQNATTSATAANEAAQKVVTAQKPYNDALAAVKMAENAVRLAKQQDEIAQRELQQSQAKVPVVKEQLAGSEQAFADAKAALESATQLLTESDQAIRSVTFSPDGRYLATAGDFSSAHLWDSEKGTALGAFAGHQDALVGISFLNDQYLVTGSNDQSAVVWELSPSWKLERTIGSVEHPEMISDRVMSVDFSADSSQILVAGGVPSRTGEFHVFQVADGTRTFSQPQAHDDVIHAARFSPDGKRIATAGADKYVRTFDSGSNQMLRRFEGHTNYVLGLAWKSDGQTLVSSGADDSIKVWDPDTGDQRVTISNNFRKHVTSVRFIGDSDTIVSSCGDRIVRMHTASNGGNIRNFNGATAWLHCVDSTPNLEYLAAGAADGSIRIWNGTNGQLLHTITSGPQEAPVK